jgi:hypothetical protein
MTACAHLYIVEVVAFGEKDPIAYLCTNPDCYAQLELADPAVDHHRRMAGLRRDFSAPTLEDKAREVREYSVENAWVQIHPFTDDARDRMRKAVGMPSLAEERRRQQEQQRRLEEREIRRQRADQLWAALKPEDANDGIPDRTEV